MNFQRNVEKKISMPYHMFNSRVILTFVSWVLIVNDKIINLISNLIFEHNLSLKSPNGECEPIFHIYISRPFQFI